MYRVRNFNTGLLARYPSTRTYEFTYEEALTLHFRLGSANVPTQIEKV